MRDANPFTQTDRIDTVAGTDHQKHGQQPFPQRQFGAVHGCLAGDGKLSFAMIAFVNPFAAFEVVNFMLRQRGQDRPCFHKMVSKNRRQASSFGKRFRNASMSIRSLFFMCIWRNL